MNINSSSSAESVQDTSTGNSDGMAIDALAYPEPEVASASIAIPSELPVDVSWTDSALDEELIFIALNDKNWDWRTLSGLERSTRLSRQVIIHFLKRHSNKIEESVATDHDDLVFRLKNRRRSIAEWFIDRSYQALDYFSLGKRS